MCFIIEDQHFQSGILFVEYVYHDAAISYQQLSALQFASIPQLDQLQVHVQGQVQLKVGKLQSVHKLLFGAFKNHFAFEVQHSPSVITGGSVTKNPTVLVYPSVLTILTQVEVLVLSLNTTSHVLEVIAQLDTSRVDHEYCGKSCIGIYE